MPGSAATSRPAAPADPERTVRLGRFRLAPDSRAEATRRRRLQRDLEASIEEGHFALQPQSRVALETGEIVGVDALLRWPHRKHGLIPASGFVPVAEESGQIIRIGAWMLTAACNAAMAEAPGWPPGGIVSVRISNRQLADGLLLAQVADALDASHLSPERLEIALPEPHPGEVDLETLLTLSAIRDLGVGLALDGFGTGAVSLAMLRHLPLTAMRLDRALVRDVGHDRETRAIVRAVVALGQALGLQVVADGIETEAQRRFLATCGCESGHGPLFTK